MSLTLRPANQRAAAARDARRASEQDQFIGTVTDVRGGLVKFKRPGQTEPDNTYYASMPGWTFAAGDRCAVMRAGASWLVLGPAPQQPCYVFQQDFYGSLTAPGNVAVNPAGTIYVSDTGGVIHIFDSTFNETGTFGSSGTGDGQFHFGIIGGLSTLANGHVLATDTVGYRVEEFLADGTYVTSFGTHGAGPGQFMGPGLTARTANGHVYVSDSDRVEEFDAAYSYVNQFGSGVFDFVAGLAVTTVAGQEHLFVLDRGIVHPSSVWDYLPDGTLVGHWGVSGTGVGELQLPVGMAASPGGDLVIADGQSGVSGLPDVVKTFTPAGVYLCQVGGAGGGLPSFALTGGVAFLPDGRLLAVDSAHARVVVFEPF